MVFLKDIEQAVDEEREIVEQERTTIQRPSLANVLFPRPTRQDPLANEKPQPRRLHRSVDLERNRGQRVY